MIFIPRFNLLDFRKYNKIKKNESYDLHLERAEYNYKKYIIMFRQLQAWNQTAMLSNRVSFADP